MEASNVKAMREALEAWLKAYDDFVAKPRNGEWTQSPCGTVVIPPITAARLVEMTTSALSAPLRNCDVGSVWEQIERHRKWCHETSCHRCVGWDCFARWAQMPYAPDTKKEIDEPKSKGDVNEKED